MKKFETELEHLKQRVLEMGRTAEDMVTWAFATLVQHDQAATDRVIAAERALDRMQLEIDSEAIRLITVYTPIAKDLRFLLVVTRINVELERIGDQAENTCEYIRTLADVPPQLLIDGSRMFELTSGMVRGAMQAFEHEDVEQAEKVLQSDDEVDRLYHRKFSTLLTDEAAVDHLTRGVSMSLILVARALERIADHATNICEEVIFMVKSEDIRHQH